MASKAQHPEGKGWYCETRNGTRYCYRHGERCQLIKSKAGTYWICDGPIATSRSIRVEAVSKPSATLTR